MSKQACLDFLQKIAKDSSVRGDLEKAAEGKAAGVSRILALGAAKGYNFSADDLSEALKIYNKGVLSETELEEVAGGFNPQPDPPARGGHGGE